MEEINNFQQEPDESLFRAWERFKELLMKCPQHYLTDMQEVILFYNRLDVPTRQILDSKGAIPTKTSANAKIAIKEMAEYSQKWYNGTSRTRSTETSDGLAAIQTQLNSLGREIKKVNQKVYAAQVGCELCKGPHYTKDCPLKEEEKTLKETYYTQFGAPYQPGGQYKAAGPGFYQRNNGNSSYPDRRQTIKESLTKFMAESAKRHEENPNIIKEIRASTDAAIRNQGASIKTLEIQIGQMSKVLQESGFGSLPSSTKTNPRDHVKSILTAKDDSTGIHHIRLGPYAISDSQISNVFSETVPFPRRLHDYCYDEWKEARELKILETYSIGTILHDDTLPQKEKYPGSFTLPCFIHNVCFDKVLVDLGARVSVLPFSTYINLSLGDLAHTRLTIELADRIIKHLKGIDENMLVRIGKFIFPIDFIILDIPEDGDVPLILRRPFLLIVHAKIDVFKRKITLRVGEEKIIFKSIKPATSIIIRVYMLKINLDSKTKLIVEAVNKSFDPHYGDYIELNDLDVPLEPRMNQNGFSIIDDMDVTSGVVHGMPFCKKFESFQKIMEKFARRDKCEQLKEE
ncbi:retrovirus-related pol polyprotein from transposon TNT 1-94 [Tanacetum coccineum]